MLNHARLDSMVVEVPKDTDIDVRYVGPYMATPEVFIVDIQLQGGRSISLHCAYHPMVRLFGQLKVELDAKDKSDVARAIIRDRQTAAEAEDMAREAEGRS